MGWQDYIVGVIGLVVAGLIIRRVVCFFRGRKRGGCASCAKAGCPLHDLRKKQ